MLNTRTEVRSIPHTPQKTGKRPLWQVALIACAASSSVGGVAGQALAAPVPAVAQVAAYSDRLSVEVIGRGPDVILIPGLASSRESWRVEAERLSASHRVHLVQLAGFAGEPWDHADGPFLQPAVEAVSGYIQSARLDRPAVVGHSLGGLMALMLAQAHPDQVSRVMSVDSLPFFSALYGPTATVETARPFAEQARAMLLNAPAAGFEQSQSALAEGYSRDAAMRRQIVTSSLASDRQAMASAMYDVMTTDVRPRLAAMTTPVWALYASDTQGGVPQAMADALWQREYAALPGVQLHRVDGSRHFIMADQPAQMAALMDEFLAD